ncbi:MAG: hypothetical protein CME26_16070 [Gemmatimonadetes bacterium]|nr:hypothetical protein [Gemmatimonadota bacterium]|tara:strand:+ start:1725 stop:2615 length:891 start_codon:yes stop_codon:yes gene_type:complete
MADSDMVVQNVEKQRARLLSITPVTYGLIAGLDIQPTEDPEVCDTFATDGEIIIVNTVFASGLVDLDIRGILLHESLHIELYHHTRLARWLPKVRRLYPEWTDENFLELWNVGADYAINGALKRSENYGRDFTLPDETLYHDIYSGAGWSVEKIVGDMLRKGWKPTPKPPPPPGRAPTRPGNKPLKQSGDQRIGDVRVPLKYNPDTPEKEPTQRIFKVGKRVYGTFGPASPFQWGSLPIEQIAPGDFIELPMDQDEAKRVVDAVRTSVNSSHYSWKWGWDYSVLVTERGIEIWREE